MPQRLPDGVVLFGGTFDPVHEGHVALCEYVHDALGLGRILLLPTTPFYKPREELAPPEDRLRMCELAVARLPYVQVDGYDLERDPPCYTADLLLGMRARYPGERLYLLLGGDAFAAFCGWRRWRECAALATLLVAGRGRREAVDAARQTLAAEGADAVLLENPELPLSSSAIRRELAGGGPGRGLDPAVRA